MSLIALVCSVDGCEQPIHARRVFIRPDGTRAVLALCEADSGIVDSKTYLDRKTREHSDVVGGKALRVAQ